MSVLFRIAKVLEDGSVSSDVLVRVFQEMERSIGGPIVELASDYQVVCIGCGTGNGLVMISHQDDLGRMVGWLFSCLQCAPELYGQQFRFPLQDAK